MIRFVFILVLPLLASLASASSPTEVIHLTDATFEHDTQASTGQTTGVWAVLLSAPSVGQRHSDAASLWAKLAENEDEEKGEIYAYVNLDENKGVVARFVHHVPSIPSLLLLRGRGMYVYPLPEDDAEDHIVGIINGGYSQLTKHSVPAEVHPSQIDAILAKNAAAEWGLASKETVWTP